MTVKTSTGLDQNIASALSYAVGWVTGLVFFFIEKEDRTVRFHAMQSIIVFGALTIIRWVFGIFSSIVINIVWRTAGYSVYWFVSFFMGLIGWIIGLGIFAIWAFLIYKAYQGEEFMVPIAGKIAAKQVGKDIEM